MSNNSKLRKDKAMPDKKNGLQLSEQGEALLHLPIFKEGSDERAKEKEKTVQVKGHRLSGNKKTGLEKRILYTERQKAEQLEKLKQKKVIKAGQQNTADKSKSNIIQKENNKEFNKQFVNELDKYDGEKEMSSSLSSQMANDEVNTEDAAM